MKSIWGIRTSPKSAPSKFGHKNDHRDALNKRFHMYDDYGIRVTKTMTGMVVRGLIFHNGSINGQRG